MERPFLFMLEKGGERSMQVCRQQAGNRFMWSAHEGPMCVSAFATTVADRATETGDASVQIQGDSRKMHVMLRVSDINCCLTLL